MKDILGKAKHELMVLASNAKVDVPEQWVSDSDKTYAVSLRSPLYKRTNEAIEKTPTLYPLLNNPIGLLFLPLVECLPFANEESKKQIEKEVKVVRDYWSGK